MGFFISFAPGGIRTPDHLVRSQILYPAELRAQMLLTFLAFSTRPERFELPTPWFVARYSIQLSYGRMFLAEREGFEPSMGFCPILP